MPTDTPDAREAFQERVAPWMQACFGPEISADRIERNHRFLEEALELKPHPTTPQFRTQLPPQE